VSQRLPVLSGSQLITTLGKGRERGTLAGGATQALDRDELSDLL
jgi:hypothetical protein